MTLTGNPRFLSSGSSRPFTLLWNQDSFLPLSCSGLTMLSFLSVITENGVSGSSAITATTGTPLARGADEHLVLLAGRGRADLQVDALLGVEALLLAAVILRMHRPRREVDAHDDLVLRMRRGCCEDGGKAGGGPVHH